MKASIIWSTQKFINESVRMNNRESDATLLATRANFSPPQFAMFVVGRSIARARARDITQNAYYNLCFKIIIHVLYSFHTAVRKRDVLFVRQKRNSY